MATRDYMPVSLTTTGDTARIKPVRDEDIYRVRDNKSFLLAAYNLQRVNNKKGTSIGHQTFTTQAYWPFKDSIVVTADASGGATSISAAAGDVNILRDDYELLNPLNNEVIRITADPSAGATSFSVSAITNAIEAGTELTIIAKIVGESWQRPTPISRGTDSFSDNITTFQHSTAISWHMANTEMYGEKEEPRIKTDFMDEFEMSINRGLLFNEPADGSSSGRWKGSGLQYLGFLYNHIPVNGRFSFRDYMRIDRHFRKLCGQNCRLVAITSQRLMGEAALWPINRNIPNVANNMNWGQTPDLGMTKTPDFVAPWGGPATKMIPDYVFDNAGLDDRIIFVNMSVLEVREFGEMLLQGPSSALPQGVADIGSGDKQWMVTRALGNYSKCRPLTACVVTGIDRFEA